MSDKLAAIEQAVKFSKKCPECGLRNFPGEERCSRCDVELARSGKKAAKPKEVVKQEILVDSADPGSSRIRSLAILATMLVVLFGVVLFYLRQDLLGTPEPLGEVRVTQDNTTAPESAEQKSADEVAQSQEPKKQVVARLKRFQAIAKPDMRFEEYEQMLSQLESDVNSILPTIVSQRPSDVSLRQEVSGALRDYTAARNWWKTTTQYSSVLSEKDRVDRLKVEWASAQTHLDKAEKLLSQ